MKEYKVLFDTFYTSLCLFSNKYLDDIDLSKDIVQEVFIKIWDQEIIFENEFTIKSCLYTSVRNKSLDYLRSKEYKVNRKLSIEDIKVLESDVYFEKEVLLEEYSRVVTRAIDTLPSKCKEIINLSLKGFKNEQISEELSISMNTVKTQKRIAYRKLRPLLKGYYILIAHIFYM